MSKRQYTGGIFIKEYIIDTIKTLEPSNTNLLKLISDIPLSRHTVKRRITEISDDLLSKLHEDINTCVAFSLALDESTDITDRVEELLNLITL